MKVSIVMPVFGKVNFTKSALKDLLRLDKNTHEIIVVDDCSTDDTENQVKQMGCENLFYIKNNVNMGFAYSCDHGYHHSTGDIVLFINNDIRVKSNFENWTSSLVDTLSANPNSIVGPTGGFIDPKKDFQFAYETNDPNKTINYIGGWCLAGKKETLDKLIEPDHMGPFSEYFGRAYFEDTDMSFRAVKLGIELKLVPVPVVHFGRTTTKELNINKLYNEARTKFIERYKK